ncbi:hypothetical protein EKL99_08080 [Flavobacterium sp. ZB4P23]|uniref:hypothetical protein n=1 Tax=Flavobacterium sp. ZB4P23 TaxID=2497484 RepID=UPI000F816A54|nr:hypothetical protein [Flavobacterium sp. ZB4P23]RTY82654.1 hypothetical protein EKL99_08080 [Flavobacterium sp. ZB4P23]
MKIFNTKHIENTSSDIFKKIHLIVDNLTKNEILKKNLIDIKFRIFNDVKLEALDFNVNERSQPSSELFELTEIEVKRFSQGIDYSPGIKYLKYFFEITLKEGNQDLLFNCPNKYNPVEIKGRVVKDKITLEFQTIYQTISEISENQVILQKRFKETFDKLEEGKLAINEDVKKFNSEYENLILDLLKKKKKKIEDDDDFNNSLNNF